MRLIDADALERDMQNEWEQNEISNGEWIRFREILNDVPTIDAVEVIRCGKCRHYQGNHGVPGCAPCDFWGIGGVMWDDFCKRGERREK